jgi:4-alpha-glucanotransferase
MTTAAAPERPALRALADEIGIIPEYLDQTGTETRETSDETRVAFLAAMGIDAASEAAASAALEALRAEARLRPLAPVRVVQEAAAELGEVALHLPDPRTGDLSWTLELEEEDGSIHRSVGVARDGAPWRIRVPLPRRPGLGYHMLRVALHGAGPNGTDLTADQSLIVVPGRCLGPGDIVGPRPVAGLIANLYSVRSERSWGVGDFTDLQSLVRWAGEIGAEFVGVNPLHALRNRTPDVSPYSPVSRLFRNPIYLDVEAVPELAACPRARDWLESSAVAADLDALRDADRVPYDRAWAVKRHALQLLHRTCLREGGAERRHAYARWCAEREPELTDHATFMALAEERSYEPDWHAWPRELQSPRSQAVRAWREANAEAVDFQRWLQWETDRQLGEAASAAREAGLGIGLYQDLAIGTNPGGSDAWTFGDLFVPGVNVGAPPDQYSATGQDWGLPPIDPRRLAHDRYRYFIRLVRSGFRHAGALRIDHVMGLFRLFWIPQGRTGKEGAYVRYPSEDLLGILALESHRHRALVVGEDLGTVPPDVPPALERWGVLSSKVLYFERDAKGRFRRAKEYPVEALATANTHDMPTVPAFWQAHDVTVRERVGLSTAAEAATARASREAERARLAELLEKEGVVADGASIDGGPELAGAVHELLCRTPSALVGLSLDDLAGELEPVNVPGVAADQYPSWTRRMTMTVEEMRASEAVRKALRMGGRARTAGS